MNHNEIAPHFEYSSIGFGIFIGTNACCILHFKKTLLGKGITSDISLEKERIDSPIGVTYYLWLPTRDHTAPTPKQLLLGVDALKRLVELKQKVYVHCKNGHGRAPTLVAAYLVSRGMAVEKAIALVKKRRPSIHLEPAQLRAVKKFEHTSTYARRTTAV